MAIHGYRYRLYPTASQISLFKETFAATRKTWNTFLYRLKSEYDAHSHNPVLPKPDASGYAIARRLTNETLTQPVT